jgi:hypothetical protein
MVMWTAALFVFLELVSNNIVEPWLYGSRTGLSALAILVAAIFWTWLWGPLGLLLSTPLTVCLVVLGRHVPQFEFLDVLFGNEAVLEPHKQLYQRLLAGDPDEATDRAEEFLEDNDLLSFYEKVAIPALVLGEFDRARGVMDRERLERIATSAITLVDNLEDYAQDEVVPDAGAEDSILPELGVEQSSPDLVLPDGAGKTVLCAGGRGELDDAAVVMLAQVLAAQGATASAIEHRAVGPRNIKSLQLGGVDAVVIGFLNSGSVAQARYMVRRLKRGNPSLLVGVVFWSQSADTLSDVKLGAMINCDFVAHTMIDAIKGALSEGTLAPAEVKPRKRVIGRPKPRLLNEGA